MKGTNINEDALSIYRKHIDADGSKRWPEAEAVNMDFNLLCTMR